MALCKGTGQFQRKRCTLRDSALKAACPQNSAEAEDLFDLVQTPSQMMQMNKLFNELPTESRDILGAPAHAPVDKDVACGDAFMQWRSSHPVYAGACATSRAQAPHTAADHYAEAAEAEAEAEGDDVKQMPLRRSARSNEPSSDPTWAERRREILLALSSGPAGTPEHDTEHATEAGIEHAAQEDDEPGQQPGEPGELEVQSQEHVISQLVKAIFADVTRAPEAVEAADNEVAGAGAETRGAHSAATTGV
jgi:hypothetical protein